MGEETPSRSLPPRTTRIARRGGIPNLAKPSVREATPDMLPSPEKAVYIVGGGPSLRGFDFSKLGSKHTITVNKSVFYTPNPNYFITVDHSFLPRVNISQFRSINTSKVFVADFSSGNLQERSGRIVDIKFGISYKLQDFNIIVKAYKDSGMGYAFDDFRTGRNSGFCALQLAVILGYKKIYLLGFDLVIAESTHFHEGYGMQCREFEEKLNLYFQYFKSGLEMLREKSPEVDVYSCSEISRLNKIIPYQVSEGK